jgi:hypothetical protein
VNETEHDVNDAQRDKAPPTDIIDIIDHTDHADHTDHTDHTDHIDHLDHQTESTITAGTSTTVTMATSVPPRHQDEQLNSTQAPPHEDMEFRHLGGWGYPWGAYLDGGHQLDQSGTGFGNHQVASASAIPRSTGAQDVTGAA